MLLAELAEDELVGLGEGGERPGLRADIAELQRLGRLDVRRKQRRHRHARAGGGRRLDELAPVDPAEVSVVS